jgi:hypothetical protein
MVERSTLTLFFCFVVVCSAQWIHENGRVVDLHRFDLSTTLIYHLHIPKAAGTTIKRLLPLRLPQLVLCDQFPQKLYSNPEKFVRLASVAQLPECNFVSVEGDFEAGELLAAHSRPTVTFLLLREPLELLISQWRHDLAKGKFATVAAKYAVDGAFVFAADRQPQLGFGHNEQTLRLGAGVVERAQQRLHAVHFGLVEHFHASVCLLLFAMSSQRHRELFQSGCGCDSSPLSLDSAGNVAREETRQTDVSLDLLLAAWRNCTADRRLYAYAHELFMQRVAFVERETGVRLVCAASDPVSSALPRYVRANLTRQHRGTWFHRVEEE